MEKHKARKLLQFVNTPWILEDLNTYLDYRIDSLRDLLEHVPENDKVREIQGSIKELRKLKSLRDFIQEKAQ